MKTENQNENQNQNADLTNAPDASFHQPHAALGTQHSALPGAGAPSRPRRTTRRRMRRTKPGCTSTPEAKSSDSSSPSAPSASSANSASSSSTSTSTQRTRRPHRASPFQILPEFAQLSADDLAEVHNVIRDVVIPDAQKFIFQRHGISLSGHCLYRYRSRLHLADQLQVSEDNAPAIQNLLGLLAGKPVDLDKAGIHIIKQRAVSLAADPNSSPSLLKDLFRIFTYNDRLALQRRRVKCHERMTKVAERRQKFVEKTHKKPKKHDWRDTAAAVLDVVGDLPPVIPYTGPLDPKIATDFSTPPVDQDHPPTTPTQPEP
jgi:hypothetical protein